MIYGKLVVYLPAPDLDPLHQVLVRLVAADGEHPEAVGFIRLP
jgi:hypothetical protein